MSNEVNNLRAATARYINSLPLNQLKAVHDYARSHATKQVDETINMVRCLVVCCDSQGLECLVPVIVQARTKQIEEGWHYDAAKNYVMEELHYENAIRCIDQDDGHASIAKQLFQNEVNWKDAPVIPCTRFT